MYNAKFISNDNKTFVFEYSNYVVFDIEGLSGIDVEHTMSQGAGQIGETISTKSIGSKNLTVSGVIFKNIPETKRKMRDVLTPMASGKLIFNDMYYIDVSVKETPTYSPVLNNGTFTMQFVAPYPFFKLLNVTSANIGGIVKTFRFPINYETPHIFATRGNALYTNIINNGNLETPFKVVFSTNVSSENPTISNLKTFETLKINHSINAGEKITVYRDENNILRAILTDTGNNETDIFADLDDDSNLFNLHIGDNIIAKSDDNGGEFLIVDITFNEAIAGVFDET